MKTMQCLMCMPRYKWRSINKSQRPHAHTRSISRWGSSLHESGKAESNRSETTWYMHKPTIFGFFSAETVGNRCMIHNLTCISNEVIYMVHMCFVSGRANQPSNQQTSHPNDDDDEWLSYV